MKLVRYHRPLSLSHLVLMSIGFILHCAFALTPNPLRHCHIASFETSQLRATASTPLTKLKAKTIEGPPTSSKPDYSSIHGPLGPLFDRYLLTLFRTKLSSRLYQRQLPDANHIPDSSFPLHDYRGIIELARAMNFNYTNRRQVQSIAQDVLVSLFPPFILERYPSWFAIPFPEFSSKMCAFATVTFGTWLMGECVVNDIPGQYRGVNVKRCRFLEESQCASICVNSCKIPTQNFFRDNMGLGLTMTPDYDTGGCQFSFGMLPTEEEERKARESPCLARCPTGGRMRSWHDRNREAWLEDLNEVAKEHHERDSEACNFMDG